MPELRQVAATPSDRYSMTVGRVQLTGVQALARLPIELHRRDAASGREVGTLISGYEGSPLAGYDLELARIRSMLEANDVVFVPGLNEEAAATAVQGSQLAPTLDGATRDGVVGIWYGKAPGLDRATDAIRHGNLMGSHPHGGAVLLVGDDPAAKSSSVPCASEFALQDLMVPFLHPGDSAEVIEYGLHAVELSRACGLWTALKIVTAVADGSSTVDLATTGPTIVHPEGSGRHVPTARLLQPTLGPLERDMVTTRLRIAREYSRLNRLNQVVAGSPSDRVGVVAGGRVWRDTLAALALLGYGLPEISASPLRLLKVGMPYPLDAETIEEFAEGLDTIIVVEEKRSFVETALRDALYGSRVTPQIVGKYDGGSEFIPAHGELDVDLIAARLRRKLTSIGIACGPDRDVKPGMSGGRRQLPLATRIPYFCSGCPHNSSTKAVDGALYGAGIGCHAMVLLMEESQVGAVTGLSQMGGEGLQWIGMAPFVERTHYFQNLGDGTFDHSGSLAIRAAVAAGVNITYKLLYNSAVAMTGGQQAVGGMGVSQIIEVLLAEGVSRVLVTTEDRSRYRRVRLPRGVQVWDRSRLDEAQRTLASVPGVTVLIHDQECATEKRRRRRRGLDRRSETQVFINERVCEGCGDCGRKSNCLSVQPVETAFGRKTRIHQTSCNTDLSCLDGDCPAFMSVTGAAATPQGQSEFGLSSDDLPVPTSTVTSAEFGIRIAGIGGTGVVTVSQVLANAAVLAGFTTRTLDQTGLAQKGGAVVSDLLLSRDSGSTNKLASGGCDLYLGCDLLVAADPANLNVVAAERTTVVLSTSAVPTGPMVSDPNVAFPKIDEVAANIVGRSRSAHIIDARMLALKLFGDDQYANVFLVGLGYQSGALPIPAEAIEQAIELNGVSVDLNLQAFRRGRQFVVDPESVRKAVQGDAGVGAERPGSSGVPLTVGEYADELVKYQNRRYAARYEEIMRKIRERESEVMPGTTDLTDAVATNLFKLMAYKDEYEVARLSIRPDLDDELARAFGPDARVAWRLHPPALRALGMKKKLVLGPKFRPALRMLYAMRGLRGTILDPFGRAQVRKIERGILRDYVEFLMRLADELTTENWRHAVNLAVLPDMVRGYEGVKLANVARYRDAVAEGMAAFELGHRRTM